MCARFSGKTDNFDFFGPNLLKNGFWGQNCKNLSPDRSQHLQDTMCANFLSKRKTLNYMRYFGSNNVEGVAESWVEAEMSWVEVDGAGWFQ